MNLIAGVLVASALLTGAAFAQGEVRLGNVTFGGNGCVGGDAQVITNEDGSMALRFTTFSALAGGDTGRNLDRKACNIAVPLMVPPNTSVAIGPVIFQGRGKLPEGTRAVISIEHFFPGTRGPVYTQMLAGPLKERFELPPPDPMTLAWSPCGASTILRTNASITLNSDSGAMASIVMTGVAEAGIITKAC